MTRFLTCLKSIRFGQHTGPCFTRATWGLETSRQKGTDELRIAPCLGETCVISPRTKKLPGQFPAGFHFLTALRLKPRVMYPKQETPGLKSICRSSKSRTLKFVNFAAILWMDEIYFAPPEKPWNDDSPVNTSKQWAKWCRTSQPSTVRWHLPASSQPSVAATSGGPMADGGI